MDVNKEKQLNDSFDAFINIILKEFSIEHLEEMVMPDVSGFGTTIDEQIKDIQELKSIIFNQKEQGANFDISYTSLALLRRFADHGNSAVLMDEVKVKLKNKDLEMIIPMRLSTLFEYTDSRWKLSHFHGSTAVESEGDTYKYLFFQTRLLIFANEEKAL